MYHIILRVTDEWSIYKKYRFVSIFVLFDDGGLPYHIVVYR